MGTPGTQICVRFVLWPALFEIQGYWNSEKSEMYRATSDWPWTLNNQKYPIYIPHIYYYIYIYTSFWDTVLLKFGRKCTEWPQNDFGHSTVKRIPNLCPFLLYDLPFLRNTVTKNQKKSEMQRKTSELLSTLNHQKYSQAYIHLVLLAMSSWTLALIRWKLHEWPFNISSPHMVMCYKTFKVSYCF